MTGGGQKSERKLLIAHEDDDLNVVSSFESQLRLKDESKTEVIKTGWTPPRKLSEEEDKANMDEIEKRLEDDLKI